MGRKADLIFLGSGHKDARHRAFFFLLFFFPECDRRFCCHLLGHGQRTARLTPAIRHRSHFVQLVEVDVIECLLVRIQLGQGRKLIVKIHVAEKAGVREKTIHGASPTDRVKFLGIGEC